MGRQTVKQANPAMGGQYTDTYNIDSEGENKVQRKRVNSIMENYPHAHTEI